jgi:enoyl-CoA hydratase
MQKDWSTLREVEFDLIDKPKSGPILNTVQFARRKEFVKLHLMTSQHNDAILFHVDQQGIATLQVNRRQAHNALNRDAQDRFAAYIEKVNSDKDIRALIITGSGEDAFVSGGDLKEILYSHDAESGRRLNRVMSHALADLKELPLPVIAAINGNAFGGGCEIITACDLRIAAERARFGFAQVRNGLTTGWGGAARLVQLIGLSRACELLLSGRIFDAQEAHHIGLVHRLVPHGEDVLEAARAWAEELIQLPAGSQAALKALAYAATAMPEVEVRELETKLFMEQWASPDHLEALAAFAEKRQPVFNRSH